MNERYNLHHLQFNASDYNRYRTTKKFRQIGGLIVPLFVSVHNELHDNIARVPMMDEPCMEKVINNFSEDETYLGSYNNLITAYERTLRHEHLDKINRQIGEIALQSLIDERHYLQDGLVCDKINL